MKLRILTVWCVLVACSIGVSAQIRSTKPAFGQLDSLIVSEEWWLGGRLYGTLNQQFGTLTVQYVGGTAPGSTQLSTPLNNGDGYGGGMQAALEYRAPDRPWSFVFAIGAEYQYATSESPAFVNQGVFAYRARFEAVSSQWYLTPAFEARLRLNRIGTYLSGGFQVDLPLAGNASTLWQHEELDGATAGEPGFPNTSIKYGTTINYSTRVNGTIGIGHDFMVGLYGYNQQLITPYFAVHVGTPITSNPTSWNGASFRIGMMWRRAL